MPTKKDAAEGSQPEVNIGIVGHVDHGKTTLLEQLSGKWADTHSEEIKRGITIRLGYADVQFYKHKKDGSFATELVAKKAEADYEKSRKVSFVDAPGHESLMATMLAGATIIDGAILLISSTEKCPQPQTKEHIMALEIIGVKNLVVIQNKIDLVTEEEAMKNYEQIQAFLKETPFKGAPIIPLSAQHGAGMSALIGALNDVIPTPERDVKADPRFLVARSFDINKPGTPIEKMVGGVLGGVLKQGTFKPGDEIEIKPGYDKEEKNQRIWIPVTTTVTAVHSGGADLQEAVPGGSIGIQTLLDPSVVSSDRLSGSVAGLKGKLPAVWQSLKLEVHLLDRVVGVKKDQKVEQIVRAETLMLNVNSTATVGRVQLVKKGITDVLLKLPVCADVGARVTISRMVGNRFRLIGYGIIKE